MAKLSKEARAMVDTFGDRMAARAVAYAGAVKADEYRADCDAKGNRDGAAYWREVQIAALGIVREIDGETIRWRRSA